MNNVPGLASHELHLRWAVAKMREMAEGCSLPRTIDISHAERQSIYGRRLACLFERRLSLHKTFQDFVLSCREEFQRALASRSCWGGELVRLDEALVTSYRGLSHLETIQQFGADFRVNLPHLQSLDGECTRILCSLGLRASWAGPMALAATLKFVWYQEANQQRAYDFSMFVLWPAGPAVEDEPSPIQCASESVSMTMEARLRLANIDRDVEATYLSLSGMRSHEIIDRIRPVDAYYPTRSTIDEAVVQVLSLLDIERPRKPRGRPPKVHAPRFRAKTDNLSP